MSIKTMFGFYLSPVRTTIIKKTKKKMTSVGKDAEQEELWLSAGENVNWSCSYGSQCANFSKK